LVLGTSHIWEDAWKGAFRGLLSPGPCVVWGYVDGLGLVCCGGINYLGSVSWVCGECVRLCGVAGGGLVGGGTGWGLGKLETGPYNGSFWDENS